MVHLIDIIAMQQAAKYHVRLFHCQATNLTFSNDTSGINPQRRTVAQDGDKVLVRKALALMQT